MLEMVLAMLEGVLAMLEGVLATLEEVLAMLEGSKRERERETNRDCERVRKNEKGREGEI